MDFALSELSDPILMRNHLRHCIEQSRLDERDPRTARKVREVANNIETMTRRQLKDLLFPEMWEDVMAHALRTVQGDDWGKEEDHG